MIISFKFSVFELEEDAKNRLDSYWLYLDWFEDKLNELAQYKKYQDVFDLEMP